ncbi:leucine-rich repeat protein [Mycoplasmopsis agalactiae]|nr:leucine-rich repeat domain-containing protein [Mycoplasmopsis agalactiae]MCE6056633.1 leucine-rich repeat protein [Mycoplasmopsis agalactiae]
MKKLHKLGFAILPISLTASFVSAGCNDKSKSDIKLDENTKLFYFDINSNNKATITAYNRALFDDSNNIVAQSKTIKIPEKVKYKNVEYVVDSIGSESFMELANLEEVEFSNEIKFIGDRAFANSSKLKSIKFSEASELEAINISAFANTNLENIILPKKLSSIASYAFANIKNDKFSLVLNSQLDNGSKLNIGQYAFKNLKDSFKLEIKNLKIEAVAGADKLAEFAQFIGLKDNQITFSKK